VDEDRNTSLLMWKTLRDSINEIQKIPCSGLGKCGDIQCYEAKDFHQKRSFNPKDKNTIIKIKGNGPGSLTANRNESKNDTNPAGST
jgi:hypothetical protein